MRKLKLGVAGLGRAFGFMLPTLAGDARLELVAAADPRPEARRRFAAEFSAKSFPSVEELCGQPGIEAIYIATPHELHAAHAALAAAAGKHILVEKPMAISLPQCDAMIEAARKGGVHLVVGHSHSFDAPVLLTRKLIEEGAVGRLRMITALNFTDFMYRPRRPEELDTSKGGGVIYSQAAHQVDVARLLGGGRLRSVRAVAGSWDPARVAEGAYSCMLFFESGVVANLAYSGYAHFDSDEFMGWIGEMGLPKDPHAFTSVRRALAGDETTQKMSRNYGGARFAPPEGRPFHSHFGLLIASCERADLRPLPTGVMVYGDEKQMLRELPTPAAPRAEVIDELYGAAIEGKAPLHSGEWARATLEACLAILESSASGKEIALRNQTGLPT